MRKTAALSLIILAACGGAQKPAGSSADTASLEAPGAGAASEPSTPASTSDDSAPKPAPEPKPAAAPASAAAAPAAATVVHPTPAATGSIDGKAFSPKVARATGAMQKDGRLLLTITEGTECGAPLKSGEGALSLLVEWKDGYKTDVGSLKRATKPGGGEVGFSRGGSVSKSFKPTGRVTVVSAPTDQNATGKLKVDLQSGEFMLAGDLDVLLCVAAK